METTVYNYRITITYDHPNAGRCTDEVTGEASSIAPAISIALRKLLQEHRTIGARHNLRCIRAINEAVSITAIRLKETAAAPASRPGAHE